MKNNNAKETKVGSEKELTLDNLPIGASATILKIVPKPAGRKNSPTWDFVPGTELIMEAHAPFGGLIRVKVMETSMALHSDDAKNIVLKGR